MAGVDSFVRRDKGIKVGLEDVLSIPRLVGPDIEVDNCKDDEVEGLFVDIRERGMCPSNNTPGKEEVKARDPCIEPVIALSAKVVVELKDGVLPEICIIIGKTVDPVL